METKLNTIEEAIEDFKQGKLLICVDDEDRENEGDFIFPAEKITHCKLYGNSWKRINVCSSNRGKM